ncbi:MAG: DUF3306 domain-containing protein [Pseudomonadota bacterium]
MSEELPEGADSARFLSRWSARKNAAKQASQENPEQPTDLDTALDVAEANATAPADATDEAVTPATHEERDAPPDLPDIDTLEADSDYSGFLHPEVDKLVRKAALRKLFSMPQFGVRDGLDDYDDDFTVFEPLGDTVTSDMRFHEARKRAEAEERERLAAQTDATEAGTDSDADTSEEETVPSSAAETVQPVDDTAIEGDSASGAEEDNKQ